MQGMVGTRPSEGQGPLFRELLKAWADKDAEAFPGVIHASHVQQVSGSIMSILKLSPGSKAAKRWKNTINDSLQLVATMLLFKLHR